MAGFGDWRHARFCVLALQLHDTAPYHRERFEAVVLAAAEPVQLVAVGESEYAAIVAMPEEGGDERSAMRAAWRILEACSGEDGFIAVSIGIGGIAQDLTRIHAAYKTAKLALL